MVAYGSGLFLPHLVQRPSCFRFRVLSLVLILIYSRLLSIEDVVSTIVSTVFVVIFSVEFSEQSFWEVKDHQEPKSECQTAKYDQRCQEWVIVHDFFP